MRSEENCRDWRKRRRRPWIAWLWRRLGAGAAGRLLKELISDLERRSEWSTVELLQVRGGHPTCVLNPVQVTFSSVSLGSNPVVVTKRPLKYIYQAYFHSY